MKKLLLTMTLLPLALSSTTFEEITNSSGFNASHSSSIFGVGQAFIDVNNDGYLDIFVTDQLGPNHLYINQKNETFTEKENFQNIQLPNQKCIGVSVADFDNDGWDDIYINCLGDNHLFKNTNGTGFIDVTNSAGVNDSNYSQVSAWADINNDGWLDLYVVNYNNGLPGNGPGSDSLFLSNKDSTFSNISSDLDEFQLNKPGLAVTFFDYDNDGDQDLYVVIDRFHGNVLWQNNGPARKDCGVYWCFKNVSSPTNTGQEIYGMGIATGDIDLDGDYDLYFTSINEQFLLLNQTSQGSSVFIDASENSPLNLANAAGWGTLFFDYNNDSYLDAMLATYGTTNETAEKIFKGYGDTTFSDATLNSGILDLQYTEGIAFGDINNDGRLDLIKGNRNDSYKIYKNTHLSDNNWIVINLVGYNGVNRNAIGSRVTVLTSDGKSLVREVTAGDSRGSTNQRALHFGLSKSQITSISIEWPNGETQILTNVTENSILKIINPTGQLIYLHGFE